MRKIYTASSWRNDLYPPIVEALRAAGHEVFDFRRPGPNKRGFFWSEIDPDWLCWTPEEYKENLLHPIAQGGFESDMDGMEWADTCVLILPCGRSAHLEAGWFIGKGKDVFILLSKEGFEPELMYKLALHRNIHTSLDSLLEAL